MKQPNWITGSKILVVDKKSDKFQQFGIFIEFKQMSTGLRAVVEFNEQKQRSFLLKQIRYLDPNQVYKVLVISGWYGSLAGFWRDYKRCRIVAYPNPPYTVGFVLEDSNGAQYFIRNIEDLRPVDIEQERRAA